MTPIYICNMILYIILFPLSIFQFTNKNSVYDMSYSRKYVDRPMLWWVEENVGDHLMICSRLDILQDSVGLCCLLAFEV